MNFIEEIKQRARKDLKTIVLPEAEDIRILVVRKPQNLKRIKDWLKNCL